MQSDRVKEIFLEALKCPEPDRQHWLATECAGDERLMLRVRQLLVSHYEQCDLIDIPIVPAPGNEKGTAIEGPGSVIGPFRLIEQIGEGGFGIVFAAEQVHPVKRQVALKVIKPGMDSKQVLARFEGERQALAMMDHPHIATIFDGGMTDSGRPYFAMELVKGQTVTDFCEEQHLSIPQRLELFLDLCRAVEHAHQRGIIHRDIKPNNILVTLVDGTNPFVKVIDFGIAKALGEDLSDRTLLTRQADMIGTPLYMSPEQSLNDRSIDTRSDVYSLGVVLYELVTGTTPFDRERTRRSSWDAVLKMIREEDPPYPSQQSSVTAKLGTTITSQRRTHQTAKRPAFRRELDWLIMKAMAKNRELRYSTVDAFITDLRHYLNDEPLDARPPSAMYRLGKFCKRHLVAAGVIAAFLTTLVAIAMVLALANQRLSSELARVDRAQRAERQANVEANHRLWLSYLNEAHATHQSRRPGQRFAALRAIHNALDLPIPQGHSRVELRNEATAALCLPDLETEISWPHSSRTGSFSINLDHSLFATDNGPLKKMLVRDMIQQTNRLELDFVDWDFDWRGPSIFSPNGKYFCYPKLVDNQTHLHLWSLDESKKSLDCGADFYGLAFSNDSGSCAISYGNGDVAIVDLQSFHVARRFATTMSRGTVTWSPQGDRIAVLTHGTTQIISANSGEVLVTLKDGNDFIGSPRWHPSGRKLAMSFGANCIGIWDTTTGTRISEPLTGHQTGGVVVAFSPDGKHLVSNDWHYVIRLWELNSGRQLLSAPARGAVLQFSSDQRYVGADFAPQNMNVYRFDPGSELERIAEIPGRASFDVAHNVPCFDSTGRLFAIRSDSGVVMIDSFANEVVATIPIGGNGAFRFHTEDGRESLWTYGKMGLLQWPIQRTPTEAEIRIGPPERLASLTSESPWASDLRGIHVIAPAKEGGILWNRQTKKRTLLPHPPDIRSTAMTPDGKFAATGTHALSTTTVRIWDVQSATKVADLDFASSSGVGFSPDGRWLVTNGGGVRLWRTGDWTKSRLVSDRSNDTRFSADGTLLAISDDRRNILRLIDPESGRDVAILTCSDATRLNPAAFSHDSHRLYAVGIETGCMYVFHLDKIRRRLAEMGLDWDWPPFAPSSQAPTEMTPPAVEVTLDLGNLSKIWESGEMAERGKNEWRSGKYADAIATWNQSLELDPANTRVLNQLSWIFTMGPVELRDTQKGLALAETLVRLDPGFTEYQNTYGAALFRAGQYEAAIAAVEQSIVLSGTPDAFDAVIMAMSHVRLGNNVEALRWRTIWTEKAGDPATRSPILRDAIQEAETVVPATVP